MNLRTSLSWILSSILALVLFAPVTLGQARATLRGSISDEVGAVIVGATVTLTDASGAARTAISNADGGYVFNNLASGKYTLMAAAAGFATSDPVEVQIAAGQRQPENITLKIAVIESQVKIDSNSAISTDASQNANQTVITGRDLDALPDDPDELAAALQAMAGPSIGPNGGQIFIDGFSGGNMPSKESIREIRINQNPFAAENDQPSGRIDILTRPGTDKLRVGMNLNFNDESFNSRNPFQTSSSKRTPFQVRQYGGNVSGPLKKGKASFYFDLNRNETDDNDVVRATLLDAALNPFNIGRGVLVPRRFTSFSPRIDYAINPKNTLVARYNYNHNAQRNIGVSGTSLPEVGFSNSFTNQVFQVTETAVLNNTTINETRFQFSHNHSESAGDLTPVLSVGGSFTGGGSGVGHPFNNSNRWELNNFTSMQRGNHTIKFGGRIRGVSIHDVSPNGFGGTWIFSGGFGPALDAANNPVAGSNIPLNALERYRRTLLFQQLGRTPTEIRSLGGGASVFRINTGNPEARVSQFDIEPFIQDDWRIKPNLTFSYGLRYEIQNNAGSKLDFAPRLAFAWSPGGGNSARPPKMVIRGGTGIFYNRFSENQTLAAHRFDGATEFNYVITDPFPLIAPDAAKQATQAATYSVLNSYHCANGSFTPDCIGAIPSVAGVPVSQQTIQRVSPRIQIPTVYVAGGQLERQLPHNFTVTLGAYAIRILHVIRLRDVNAPLPGTIGSGPGQADTGIRPDPTKGEIYQYEASAKFNQRQLFIGFNSRLNPAFSISGNYSLSKSSNDADGQGSNSLPMNSYDVRGEYGRSGFDVRHRFFLVGTYNSKVWKLVFSPFVTASSGPAFNIFTGTDTNLDRALTERPSFASASAPCGGDIKCTPFGKFNLKPLPGETIIPRNYGQAPGAFTVNLRVSRTFGFGDLHKGAQANAAGDAKGAGAGSPGGAPVRGPMIAGGGSGGERGQGGPGGGGMQRGGPGGGGGPATEKKYTLQVSLAFQNLLNNVNLGFPEGNLASPLFGLPRGLTGNFGGFGGGGSSNAGNRRIYLNMRLNF